MTHGSGAAQCAAGKWTCLRRWGALATCGVVFTCGARRSQAVWSWRPCQLAHGPALLSCPWSRVRIPVRGGFVSCPSAPAARCVCLATKRAPPRPRPQLGGACQLRKVLSSCLSVAIRHEQVLGRGITGCLGHCVFGCKHESILNKFRFTVYVPAVDGSLYVTKAPWHEQTSATV